MPGERTIPRGDAVAEDGRTVLVVDDEELIRRTFQRALERAGHSVITAPDGERALALVAEHQPGVIFLDLWMPRMTGIEISERIREIHPLAFLVAVTGYASLFDLRDCRAAGFDEYFTKPVELKRILEAAARGFERLAAGASAESC